MCPRTRVSCTRYVDTEGRSLIWTFAWNYLENYSTRNIFQTELGGRSFSSCRLACNIKKNTLISDREKQTIFRRFSTTIPFFFFFFWEREKFQKIRETNVIDFPPLPFLFVKTENASISHWHYTSLSPSFFSSRIERHEPPYFPDDIYSIRDGRKGRREKGRWKFAGKEYRRTDREAASPRVKAYRAETAVPVPPIARFVAPSSSSSLRRFSRFCSGT